jgi:uncharacterized protein YggE
MKRTLFVSLVILGASLSLGRGQFGGGGATYSGQGAKAKAEQEEKEHRVLSKDELPPTGDSVFIEARVLMNVKAEEYVAAFAIKEEAETVAECSRKMEATVGELTGALKELGIGEDDLFLDFVAQTQLYGYEVAEDVAREKLVGFELKKNLSVHFRDKALLDKLVVAAARSKVYDLIKVDYVVEDSEGIQGKLMEEASRVVKRKAARYEELLGIELGPARQVYAERPAVHYPGELYDSYTAAESSEVVAPPDSRRFAIQAARKSRTFYYNGLDGDGFDSVINPVVIEPPVQFTLYLKVRYATEPRKAE